MRVLFHSREADADRLHELAVHRVHFAMRRLAWLAPRVSVHLTDINGPRGGVDKRCQLQLKTDRIGTVVVTAIARDWRSALETALIRASRMLLRVWRKNHDMRRSGKRALQLHE